MYKHIKPMFFFVCSNTRVNVGSDTHPCPWPPPEIHTASGSHSPTVWPNISLQWPIWWKTVRCFRTTWSSPWNWHRSPDPRQTPGGEKQNFISIIEMKQRTIIFLNDARCQQIVAGKRAATRGWRVGIIITQRTRARVYIVYNWIFFSAVVLTSHKI